MRSRKYSASSENRSVRAVHDGRPSSFARRQIVGHAGHDVAGAVFLVVSGGLLSRWRKRSLPQVVLNLARDADDDPSRKK